MAGKRVRIREARADLYGYTAELLAKAINEHELDTRVTMEDREKFVDFLRSFGRLGKDFRYSGSETRGYAIERGAGNRPGAVGDPFALHLLHPDGRASTVTLHANAADGVLVQCVVPAGTWQAGELVPGGRYALFGCTMAPGFTGSCFEAGLRDDLRERYPAAAATIERLALAHGDTRMPEGFAS